MPAFWTAAMLAAIGAMGTVSAALQGQDLLSTLIWIAVLVVPLILLHPERAAVLHGGIPSTGPGGDSGGDSGPTKTGPGPLAKVGLLVLGGAGLAMATGVVLWCLSGGSAENPREDDVVGLALRGFSLVLGAFLSVRRRMGWRALASLLGGMDVYCVVASASIAIS